MTGTKNGAKTTVLITQIRRLDEYEDWKRAVFRRDSFTCQQCGARNGRKRVIEAHHLRDLAQLVSDHNITTIEQALECSFLWAVSNGQTLCHSCHEQTETFPERFRAKKTPDHKGPKVLLQKEG